MERVSSQPLEIFYCYARKDRELRDELDIHLAGLRRSGLIAAWYDGAISPGIAWEQEIAIHLDTARIILLLISPDFIHSDYCYSKEMARAIERHQRQEARVIPILLRPTDWAGTPFSILQMLPSNTLPITRWPDRDEAFEDVVKGIRQTVAGLLSQGIAAPHPPIQGTTSQLLQNVQAEEQKIIVSHSLQSLQQANGPHVTQRKSDQQIPKMDQGASAHGLQTKKTTSPNPHLLSQISHILFSTRTRTPSLKTFLPPTRWKQLLHFLFSFVEGIILFRFFLKLIGADQNNQFAGFLYALTSMLLYPFSNIIRSTWIHLPYQDQAIEWSTLIAMICYGIIFWMVLHWLGVSILGHKR